MELARLTPSTTPSVEFVIKGQDASFQNKAHLALEAAAFADKEAKEEG